MIGLRISVLTIALLLAVQVVRNAAVAALSELEPASAAKFWSGHPNVEISIGLADIGRASRKHRAIDSRTFALIDDAASKAPLASQPFLVRGVQEQTTGDGIAAKRAFLAAQWRDPRSLPAAYFLANYYLSVGDTLNGLEETAVVARLSPGGVALAAPFLAAYARNVANWRKMRTLFRSQPYLEDPILLALAQDARNADTILALADRRHKKADVPWLAPLLSSLITSGDYIKARAIWGAIGRGQGGTALVFDPTFSTPGPPPPFNWSLASSSIGLAERQPGNRLHVIFYGNADGVLARQLLLLEPGTYRLRMQLVGSPVHPESLSWSVRCDNSAEAFEAATVDEVASNGWNFAVPTHCPAQWLELSGRPGDIAQQSEVVIGTFSFARVRGNA